MIPPEVLNEKLIALLETIWTGLVGKIERYDKSGQVADVTPLLKTPFLEEFIQLPRVDNIPVNTWYSGGVMVIPDYSVGDLVYLAPSTFSLERALQRSSAPAAGLRFGIEHSMVVGGVPTRPLSLPSEIESEGLVIAHESGDMMSVFKQTEISLMVNEAKIKINQGGEIYIGDENNATPSVLGDKLKSFLSDFIAAFSDNAASLTGPTAPGSPAALSPSIVEALATLQIKLEDSSPDFILSEKVKNS